MLGWTSPGWRRSGTGEMVDRTIPGSLIPLLERWSSRASVGLYSRFAEDEPMALSIAKLRTPHKTRLGGPETTLLNPDRLEIEVRDKLPAQRRERACANPFDFRRIGAPQGGRGADIGRCGRHIILRAVICAQSRVAPLSVWAPGMEDRKHIACRRSECNHAGCKGLSLAGNHKWPPSFRRGTLHAVRLTFRNSPNRRDTLAAG